MQYVMVVCVCMYVCIYIYIMLCLSEQMAAQHDLAWSEAWFSIRGHKTVIHSEERIYTLPPRQRVWSVEAFLSRFWHGCSLTEYTYACRHVYMYMSTYYVYIYIYTYT